MSRLEQIEARLSEADDFGVTLWHDSDCAYLHSAGGFECDCIRGDLEWMVDQLKRFGRCDAIKADPRTGRNGWRCDRSIRHDGEHANRKAGRRWPR